MSRPSSRMRAGGRLDQPQHGARRRWTCRSRISPTSPSVSPARDREARRHRPRRPAAAARAASPCAIGKCFLQVPRPRARRRDGSGMRRLVAVRVPAGGPMARPLLLVGRIDRAAAIVRRAGSAARRRSPPAGCSAPAPMPGISCKRPAACESPPPQHRRAAASRPSGRACRDAAAGRTAPRPPPPPPCGRHTSRSRAARSRPRRRDRA